MSEWIIAVYLWICGMPMFVFYVDNDVIAKKGALAALMVAAWPLFITWQNIKFLCFAASILFKRK